MFSLIILPDDSFEISQPRAWENENIGENKASLINNNNVLFKVNDAMKHLD